METDGKQQQESQAIDIEAVLVESKELIDSTIESWLPRTFDKATLEKLCGPARYAYDAESATKAVAVPMWDILDRGGKRWRPVLLLLIAEALGAHVDKVKDFVVLCEVVHNGTLVIDDIEDRSEVRRGGKCIHLIYGVNVAVNAGNAMYYLPLTILRSLRGKVPNETLLEAYELYGQELTNLHFGQGLDIWWHNGGKMPSVDEYLQMCAYKTGTLARLSAKLSALFAGGTPEQVTALGLFSETIGVAFQIQDDILNLIGVKLAKTKGQYGEDIHEGKRTLMVLHCLSVASTEEAKRLEDILNQHPEDQAVINEAIAIIEKNGSIEYARQKAKELVTVAWERVEQVLPPSLAKEKLAAFARFLVDRDI
ncbi:Polyprenyl synthetase family protein [Balamuthia mandrillaris]